MAGGVLCCCLDTQLTAVCEAFTGADEANGERRHCKTTTWCLPAALLWHVRRRSPTSMTPTWVTVPALLPEADCSNQQQTEATHTAHCSESIEKTPANVNLDALLRRPDKSLSGVETPRVLTTTQSLSTWIIVHQEDDGATNGSFKKQG